MSPRPARPRPSSVRSRRQRVAAGAVLATTGLLGAYLAAIRPQPTYAASLRSSSPVETTGLLDTGIPTCAQADVTVSTEGDLRDAILGSVDGSVICIDGTINLTSDLTTIDDTTLTLVGSDATIDVIDGDDQWQLIRADFTVAGDDTVTLSNIGLSNGLTGNGGGGAVYLADGGLVIADCILSSNGAFGTPVSGGAVLTQQANVEIYRSVFDGNQSYPGYGGALFLGYSTATVADTTFSNNGAAQGGAIMTSGTTLTASSISVTDDSSSMAFGAVHLQSSIATISNSFIADNTSLYTGGGITSYYSNLDLLFTTVYGNSTERGDASQAFFGGGQVNVIGSVIGSATDEPTIAVTDAVLDDTFSVATGPESVLTGTGSRNVAGGSLELGPVDGTGPGQPGRAPANTSILVTGAPLDDLGTGVDVDQLGNPRPGPGISTWTIGSRQQVGAPVVRLVLNQGRRVADGRHDVIRTSGSSVNVPAGVQLVPYIKYSGQSKYSRGKAVITVQDNGRFTWSRKIKKNRGLSAYVAWVDLKSNNVYWGKIR